MKRRIIASLWLAFVWMLGSDLTFAGSLQRQVSALPEVAAPPGGTALWIAKAMRLNGVPMTMKAFTSSADADEVLHGYERQLRGGSDTRTRRSNNGKERVLAIMTREHFITIRALDTVTGSEGTIVVSPALADLKPDKRTMFPLSHTSRVVSVQAYEDDGIEAEHISATSKQRPAIEAHELAVLLQQRGWQLLRNESSAVRQSGYVIEAQKAAALAQVTLQRDARGGDTTIMIVWRKS